MQHIHLLGTDPLELARQLTIMDFKLYSSLCPIECLGKAWSKNLSENAVNVKQFISYCNQLTSWVACSILCDKEAKKHVIVVKHWSQAANRCLEMNNYNTCMAILSGFDNSAIRRLRKTRDLVSSRTEQSINHIRKLMGSNRNFTEYREMVHSVNPPCIPFLGIYLQDLTFIKDGNPDL
ncbi:ras guanine nucleotide exchange factor domain-containing protein [Pilaira anomala]|nr:ras guanine nucleotide exchange factor domain-containing protein [Pilaira anomala]